MATKKPTVEPAKKPIAKAPTAKTTVAKSPGTKPPGTKPAVAKPAVIETAVAKAAAAPKPSVAQPKSPRTAKPAGPAPDAAKPAPAPKPKLVVDRALHAAREAAFSLAASFEPRRAGDAAPKSGVAPPPSAAIASLTDLNGKLIAAFRANAEATLDHVQAMTNVRSVSQLLELNGRFVRDQLLAFNAQSKEIAAASLEFAHEAAKPPREPESGGNKR